jgi:hypothetical protein
MLRNSFLFCSFSVYRVLVVQMSPDGTEVPAFLEGAISANLAWMTVRLHMHWWWWWWLFVVYKYAASPACLRVRDAISSAGMRLRVHRRMSLFC